MSAKDKFLQSQGKAITNLERFIKKHKDFLIPAGLMIASATADYYFTQLNITPFYNASELNPIVKNAIKFYGETIGMLIPKAGLTTVALGVAYAMDKTNHAFRKLKGKHLLYSATILNTLMALGNIGYYLA